MKLLKSIDIFTQLLIDLISSWTQYKISKRSSNHRVLANPGKLTERIPNDLDEIFFKKAIFLYCQMFNKLIEILDCFANVNFIIEKKAVQKKYFLFVETLQNLENRTDLNLKAFNYNEFASLYNKKNYLSEQWSIRKSEFEVHAHYAETKWQVDKHNDYALTYELKEEFAYWDNIIAEILATSPKNVVTALPSHWKWDTTGTRYYVDSNLSIIFSAKKRNISRYVFKVLTDANGDWRTTKEIRNKININAVQLKTSISTLKEKIPSYLTIDNDKNGRYKLTYHINQGVS